MYSTDMHESICIWVNCAHRHSYFKAFVGSFSLDEFITEHSQLKIPEAQFVRNTLRSRTVSPSQRVTQLATSDVCSQLPISVAWVLSAAEQTDAEALAWC